MIANETLVDDNGIEINVNYDYEKSGSQIEEGHGQHEVGNLVSTELKCVEVVIAGVGVDILPSLNKRQKDYVINKLTYNE